MEFDDPQRQALIKLESGKILCGDVGSGKSRTALAYYFVRECGGSFEPSYSRMTNPKDLYIITTAKKRDNGEWFDEMKPFHILEEDYGIKIVVDSWNNIQKYETVTDSFFIFDEQRLVGSGAWVKAFYKITGSARWIGHPTNNNWILLSATPGDNWSDYIPVFVANKFFKNKSEFLERHAVYSRYSKFPKIDKYLNERKLMKMREYLLVDIPTKKHTVRHTTDITVEHDKVLFKSIMKNRWNPYENKPIEAVAELFYLLRRAVNESTARIDAVLTLVNLHKKVIIFYNFDYELEALRRMCQENLIIFGEWNGHKHQPVPTGDKWVYLVQYTAGAEGWNCITTDTIIFYSLNYSYKITTQAAGRIDRRNTPYTDLYYYFIKTNSWIDKAVRKALDAKRTFNETNFIKSHKFA